MKRLLLLSSICVSFLMYGQSIEKEWNIARVIWNTAESSYILNNIDENMYGYGNFIVFEKNKTFRSYYSAPCGNDCFPSSKGTYNMIGKNKIKLVVEEIKQDGECEQQIHKKGSWNLGIYTIKKTKNGLILKKDK